MGRAPCCDKTKVKRGPWSPEEDTKLRDYIDKFGNGGNWISLPPKAGLRRCGKSCRLRWLNYLRPNIKHGDFSDQEDRIILGLFSTIGSRWSIIAAHLPGRTDNDIKNYWNTKLKKKLMSSSTLTMTSPFHINPNSHNDVKRPLTPPTTIPSSSYYNPYYVENPNHNPTKSLISNINGFEDNGQQNFPYIINHNYPQDLSLLDNNNNISCTSGFSLNNNNNMHDHYNNHNSFSLDHVNGNKSSEIMMKQEEIMMMMIDTHIDQRTKGYNGDFTQEYYNNYYNGHGDLKQMINGTCTNSNINMCGSAKSSSSISNIAENKSSSLLQHKCLSYFYS
ncbi:unnamed protein product [Cochlearia groenlandica]